ncbi:22214_t:CDS:2 [Gigaspora rosea]|nr:22214_t:CDS:2 [Gigaspora rosea]
MNFDEFKQFIQVEVDKLDFTKGIFEFDIQINFIENSERTFNELASLLCNKIEKQDGFKWRIEAYMTKQIYYWSHFIQQLYKKDDDHFKSAQVLLQNYQSHRGQLILKIENEGFRAIGFTMQLINGLKDVKELNIDATYKTIKGHFELYGLIGEILNLVFLWVINKIELLYTTMCYKEIYNKGCMKNLYTIPWKTSTELIENDEVNEESLSVLYYAQK